jgi:hypothetical protein
MTRVRPRSSSDCNTSNAIRNSVRNSGRSAGRNAVRSAGRNSIRNSVGTTAAAALAVATLVAALAPREAEAETIRGTLSFLDADGSTKPIRNAKVEIWRWRPREFGIWSWGLGPDLVTTTNSAGGLDQPIAFATTGIVTGLRVFATNDAAQVMQQDLLFPFFRQPGLPGPELQRTTSSPSDFLDFTFTFTDGARNQFNIADAMKWARDYALGRRDPRETDPINRVDVHFNSLNTYYDPIFHAVRLDPTFAMDDFTVVHEYAHYLEEASTRRSSSRRWPPTASSAPRRRW